MDKVNIEINEEGMVKVSVNGTIVGSLKSVSIRAMARKGKLGNLVSFKASRLKIPKYLYMVSELESVEFDDFDSFVADVTSEITESEGETCPPSE